VTNAVEHGFARRVDISFNCGHDEISTDHPTWDLTVCDDGTGIARDGWENVGVRNCTSSSLTVQRQDESVWLHPSSRGESLVMIASACSEMMLTSIDILGRKRQKVIRRGELVKDDIETDNKLQERCKSGKGLWNSSLALSAQDYEATSSLSTPVSNKLSIEKRFLPTNSWGPSLTKKRRTNGYSLPRPRANFSVEKKGTTIAIKGLSYINLHQSVQKSNTHTRHIQSTIQMLALAHPLTIITIQDNRKSERHNVLNFSWNIEPDIASGEKPDGPFFMARALKYRYMQVCGAEDLSKTGEVKLLDHSENCSLQKKRTQYSGSASLNKITWRVAGVVNFRNDLFFSHRKAFCETIFINSRPAYGHQDLVKFMRNEFRKYSPQNYHDLSCNVKGTIPQLNGQSIEQERKGNLVQTSIPTYDFLLHISCPQEEANIIIDGERATTFVANREKLQNIISAAVQKLFTPATGTSTKRNKWSSIFLNKQNALSTGTSTKRNECSSIFLNKQNGAASLPNQEHPKTDSSKFKIKPRIVSGKFVNNKSCPSVLKEISNISPSIRKKSTPLHRREKSEPTLLSPFSSAFLDDPIRNNTVRNEMKQNTVTSEIGPSTLQDSSDKILQREDLRLSGSNFQSDTRVLVPQDQVETGYNEAVNYDWIKSRFRTSQSAGPMKAPATATTNTFSEVALTKCMLRNASVISQFDRKFIFILADGLLCAVDQHAADERINLEKNEKTLTSRVFDGGASADNFMLAEPVLPFRAGNIVGVDKVQRAPKKKATSKDKTSAEKDMLTAVVLDAPEEISVTKALMETLTAFRDIFVRWKFHFVAGGYEKKNTILLQGVPKLCGKTATAHDFVDYLSFLADRRRADAVRAKPAFVKRVLASHACRYAVMFGDELGPRRCAEMVAALAGCDVPFICAHGRPSVVPVVDLTSVVAPAGERERRQPPAVERNTGGPLRFQRNVAAAYLEGAVHSPTPFVMDWNSTY